jgi:acetolactate synthase-1/2/3 large subunit
MHLNKLVLLKLLGYRVFIIPKIYNELSESRFIEPIIVTHELSAGYMADAVSRTTESVGTMVIVPGAGLTHAMSAIGEAYVDGIPLLVISGGINRGAGKSFQMHQLDMERVTNGLVKGYFLIDEPAKEVRTIYEAYNLAISGEPGPVFVEIPMKTQLMQENVNLLPYEKPLPEDPFSKEENGSSSGMVLVAERPDNSAKLNLAIDMFLGASNPGIYVGWGAKECTAEIEELSNMLVAPVCTTIQGISAFPADKLLHAGIGFWG